MGLPPVFGPVHGPQAHVRLGGERRHVRKVGYMPGHDHGDVEDAGRGRRGVRRLRPGKARHVFVGDVDVAQPGDDAQHRDAGGLPHIGVGRF